MQKYVVFLLSFALFVLLCIPALSYSDLPMDHWAYAAMTQAADAGLLNGYDDGAMHPEAPLSWGQALTMLGRAFYPSTLRESAAGEDAHWAMGAYQAALALAILEEPDFLPISASNLDIPITRQDTAVLLDRVLLRVVGVADSAFPSTATPVDFFALPPSYRPSVLRCYGVGVIIGYEDARFGGKDILNRAQGASLFARTLEVVAALSRFDTNPSPDSSPNPSDDTPTPPGEDATPPSNELPSGHPLTSLGSNPDKLIRLYGTSAMTRYSTQAEAERHMASVTVPVWRLDKSTGVKTPSTLTFSVHAALSSDMTAIFTEIYNDPEQFPIYSIGGYDWRGENAKGEHNCGTAVDINYIENYQIYPDGRIAAGECWLPGENPWSIPEDGSVVRIFNAHGYTWGGNGWPATSNKDYMHFSYLGL